MKRVISWTYLFKISSFFFGWIWVGEVVKIFLFEVNHTAAEADRGAYPVILFFPEKGFELTPSLSLARLSVKLLQVRDRNQSTEDMDDLHTVLLPNDLEEPGDEALHPPPLVVVIKEFV